MKQTEIHVYLWTKDNSNQIFKQVQVNLSELQSNVALLSFNSLNELKTMKLNLTRIWELISFFPNSCLKFSFVLIKKLNWSEFGNKIDVFLLPCTAISVMANVYPRISAVSTHGP